MTISMSPPVMCAPKQGAPIGCPMMYEWECIVRRVVVGDQDGAAVLVAIGALGWIVIIVIAKTLTHSICILLDEAANIG
jgi:hypothetical protein